MAVPFTPAEWQTINAQLDIDPESYGMPARSAGSVVLGSWNIRKFGALADQDGPKKTPGAFAMIERFCAQCDFVAIQEVLSDPGSLFALRDRLNAAGGAYEVIMSDVAGEAPGKKGAPERMGFLYNTARVELGHVASDLTFDRSAVVRNMNAAMAASIAAELPPEDSPDFMEKVRHWISGTTRMVGARMKTFVQFIRAPHVVEFTIDGPDGRYVIMAVNAHLVSGATKRERSQEFFALLEWLLLDSPKTVIRDQRVYLLMADLNLDFASNIDKRRQGIEAYVTNLNAERNLQAKVNFPFLDGGIRTNARKSETFDHIAWVSGDVRWPRGRHNGLAGSLGADEFDYGMFDFARLFTDAGPGAGAGGTPDFARFEHDLSDHMPIWLRLPLPNAGQHLFEVD